VCSGLRFALWQMQRSTLVIRGQRTRSTTTCRSTSSDMFKVMRLLDAYVTTCVLQQTDVGSTEISDQGHVDMGLTSHVLDPAYPG
jgi:hypothetical protein